MLYFKITNDEVLHVNIVHLCGYLDIDKDIGITDLLNILSENVPSFRDTYTFLGIKKIKDDFIVFLESYLLFLLKWDDKDIADIISFVLLDLLMGIAVQQWPDQIKLFSID